MYRPNPKNSVLITTLIALLTISLAAAPGVRAQDDLNDFSLGNNLLRQGEYEEAYRIFERLMEHNPRSYSVYDRAVTALINLKRYDEALEITRYRIQNHSSDINTLVKLGDILHISGETEEALEAWKNVIDRHPGNPHAYRHIARTMNEHRLYREAIEIYHLGHQRLNDNTIFAFELADNYLAVSDYESGLDIYLDMLAYDSGAQSRIQRQLLNYDEQQMYDMAIVLTEERINSTTSGSETDLTFRDFLVWLNMERELHRRALAAARTLERYGNNEKHILFRTGRELRSRQEFELAEEAFHHYLDLEHHPLQARSYEELARNYMDWASKLIDNNLDFGGAADSLYRKAFHTVERLTERYPRYDRIMQTLVIQAELALDHLKRPDLAEKYLTKMEQAAESESDEALCRYVEGRILLYQGDFSLARVALTRSNRLAGSGEIAEKSRYYLGLGDFYNGDFTYSRLQLRALERQNHSYFANNALQLRFLIQEAHDEEGDNSPLERYAHARYLLDSGQPVQAVELLNSVLDEPATGYLHGESVLLLARALRNIHPEIAFSVIDRYSRRPSIRRAAGERLLWERARLAELVHTMHELRSGEGPADGEGLADRESLVDGEGLADGEGLVDGEGLAYSEGRAFGSGRGYSGLLRYGFSESGLLLQEITAGGFLSRDLLESLFPDDEFIEGELHLRMEITRDTIVGYYEELLIQYPDGYYSDITRSRIRSLEQLSRGI